MSFPFKNALKDKTVLVVGSGSSIHDNKQSLLKFIEKHNISVIGVNAMTSLCIPEYHVWTNKKQYASLGGCINPKSKLIIGKKIPANIVKQHYTGDFTYIAYKDSNNLSFGKVLEGPFRTAGLLSICLAHIMGAKNIFVAGMDGYTFHTRKEIENKIKNQHCYGIGKTDDADWEDCLKKDMEVLSGLKCLYDNGVSFSIITPTKFAAYFNVSTLWGV